ncbi:ankyrin repeat-containing protein [Anaeramoeba flamelloides]|uniref:Ankyrin repeat-containing protein n=1 Tax=Anaeramoeba flamelloides TaxID=1746091 RepID=A0ABQ8ZE49_9EUKA|nr:ankyrin repeat-containing protein [Anaeramoeba flamelloides]
MAKYLKGNDLSPLIEYCKNAKQNEKDNLLRIAIFSKADQTRVKIILESGANVDHIDKTSKTPLHQFFLTKNTNIEVLGLLLEHGADPNKKVKSAFPLFFFLLKPTSIEILELMIEKGARTQFDNLLTIELKKKTPNFEICRILIKNGIDLSLVNGKNKTGLHYLLNQQVIQKDVILQFLKPDLDLSLREPNKMFKAICANSGDIELLKCIKKNHPKVCETMLRDYFVAALRNKQSEELYEYLMSFGIDLNANESQEAQTPFLHICLESGNYQAIKYLVLKGASIDIKDDRHETILSAYCNYKSPNSNLIREWIKLGADVNHQNFRGTRPIAILLARSPDLDLIEDLIKAGSSIYWENNNNDRVYDILSAYCQNHEIRKEIIEKYFERLQSRKCIKKCVHNALTNIAAYSTDIECFKFLLSQDIIQIDLKKISYRDNYLLECIRYNGNFEMIKYFVEELNFPVNGYTEAGEHSPIEHAIITNSLDIVEYLIEKVNNLNKYSRSTSSINGQYTIGQLVLAQLFGDYRSYNPYNRYRFKEVGGTVYRIIKKMIDNGFDVNSLTLNRKMGVLSFFSNHEFEEIFKPILMLINAGADPWKFNKKNRDFFHLKRIDDKMKKLIVSYLSIVKEFHKTLELAENTDLEIKTHLNETIKVHSLMIKIRLQENELSMEQICKKIGQYSKSEIIDFLKWTYGGYIGYHNIEANLKNIEIAKDIGMSELQFKKKSGKIGLLNDLKKLFQDKESMDFSIIVKTEIEENENTIQIVKEIPCHKFILQARSELFRGMFLTVNEETSKVHDYTGKSYEAIDALLQYFYLEKFDLTLDEDIHLELEDATDYYQLSINSSLKYEIKQVRNHQRRILNSHL